MEASDHEDQLLRSAALQNASSILAVRERAEQELLQAKESLEQRTAELARSLAMLRATLESTTDAILVTDGAGWVTGHNQKYLEMWQIPADLIESREHRRVVALSSQRFEDAPQFLARIEEIYAASPPETYDLLKPADGRSIERFSRVQIVDERNVGRVWSFRDITELKRAAEQREQLLQAERAARAEAERVSVMKDEFLATLSHELRTPLNAILGWSEVLLMARPGESRSGEDLKRGLETIGRNVCAQTQLIEDLLDMSRIVSGKVRLDVQSTELAGVIEAAVDSVRPSADAKGIHLRKILDPLAGPVSGDPNRLQQVVWNLLSNAVKFTPKGGKVEVLLERVNSHLEITVHDSGQGISPEFLPHVFERFRQADSSTTRSYSGLGLGLSIVKHLVELHGGQVRAKSGGEGQGAAFIVSLPVAPVRGDKKRQHPATMSVFGHPEIQLAGVKVLVVDDEPDARDIIKRLLMQCQAEVTTAASAAEGLEQLKAVRPDVLISDIGMPEQDGYQFIKEVRRLPAASGGKTPAVALTAFARSEDRTRALLAGYQMHISKPIEPHELVAMVASAAGNINRCAD